METNNIISKMFEELRTKKIICWGSGKHFKNITYPFLRKSGLIENLKGFVDDGGNKDIRLSAGYGKSEKIYNLFRKSDLKSALDENTVILIAVTGYKEIISQLSSDKELSQIPAIPSIYLESLYEDLQMLRADKPPVNFRKNQTQVIPKVIHTFWFSGEELPDKYKQCLESWKRYAPDYEIKIWTLDTYKPENCLYFDQAVERKSWAFASDYARADVLRRYGGIYMDLDVEMLKSIDDLLYNDAYMSFESLDRIECGSGMGARKGNNILDEICKDYESTPYIKEDGTVDISTCPVRYTKIIEKHGLKKNGGFQFVDDITIYPFEVLTGKSFDTGIIYQTNLSYTVHHHNGNWVPDMAKNAMEDRYSGIREFLDRI